MTPRTSLDRLADQNPVPAPDPALDSDAERTLEQILRAPRHTTESPSPRRRAAFLVAAATALVVGAAGLLWPRPVEDPTVAAPAPSSITLPPVAGDPFTLESTDGAAGRVPPLTFVSFDRPVTASDVLGALSGKATTAAPPRGDGPFDYIRLREWGFYTAQTQDGVVFDSGISYSTREDWRAEDGSGLMISSQDGVTDVVDVPPQPANSGTATPPEGTDVAGVRQSLLERSGNAFTTAQWLETYAEAWRGHVLSPAQNAAYLGVLSDRPGIDVIGETTDRAGRRGVAVSTSTPDRRTVLILDPDTGELLDIERIALSPAAVEIPVPVPTTISYTVFEDRGRATTLGVRP
ncbi:hypothetical protein [Rhodococcus sp. NBC_00297]|uniref:hypothetical protein n=1 Tax=Rhodococcus sp. NBC_00297 TaxID=2976005 RepID=UPI002E281DD4|nr:hypothetical protein [Rhodococcus sp. NBC_00297]